MALSRLPYLVLLWLTLMAVPAQAQQRRVLPPEEREEMSAERELSLVKGAMRAGFIAGPLTLVLYFMGVDATLITFWAFVAFMGASFHPVAGLLAAVFGIWIQKGGKEKEPTAERGGNRSSDDWREENSFVENSRKESSDDVSDENSSLGRNGGRSSDDEDELDDLPF